MLHARKMSVSVFKSETTAAVQSANSRNDLEIEHHLVDQVVYGKKVRYARVKKI